MSNRTKLRTPGRYERPTQTRPELGDQAGEVGARAGFRAALAAMPLRPVRRARTQVQLSRAATVEVNGVDLAPYLADLGEMPYGLEHRRIQPLPGFVTVESAPAAPPLLDLVEAGGAVREAKSDGPRGVYVIDIIRSGWNTSGSRYYPAEVLERDVPKTYPAGSHMYIDHPARSEDEDRPERSLTTLAATFLETPWAVQEADGRTVMRTTARVFSTWQPLIREAWPVIGVSINGNGHGEWGEREGRSGTIVEELTYGRSVDFVTKPGAGGRVVGLLESAREPGGRESLLREAASLGAWVESRIHLGFTELADDLYGTGRCTREERIVMSGAVGDGLTAFVRRIEADAPQLYQRDRWTQPENAAMDTEEAARVRLREATAEETRRAIDTALQSAYAREGAYCWSRDYDPDRGVVWFDTGGPGTDEEPVKPGTWQQSYQQHPDGRVELLGARVEVRPRTVYDPVRPEPSGSTVTTESAAGGVSADSQTGSAPAETKGNDMTEKSADVVAREAAEAIRDTAIRERDEALARVARYEAGERARPLVEKLLAESDLPPVAASRVRAEFGTAALPLVEATRQLDEEVLRTRVQASIAAERAYVQQLSESAGAGRPAGVGPAPSVLGAGIGANLPGVFGAPRPAVVDEVDPTVREALVASYVSRGMTREAAEAAASGRNL